MTRGYIQYTTLQLSYDKRLIYSTQHCSRVMTRVIYSTYETAVGLSQEACIQYTTLQSFLFWCSCLFFLLVPLIVLFVLQNCHGSLCSIREDNSSMSCHVWRWLSIIPFFVFGLLYVAVVCFSTGLKRLYWIHGCNSSYALQVVARAPPMS